MKQFTIKVDDTLTVKVEADRIHVEEDGLFAQIDGNLQIPAMNLPIYVAHFKTYDYYYVGEEVKTL